MAADIHVNLDILNQAPGHISDSLGSLRNSLVQFLTFKSYISTNGFKQRTNDYDKTIDDIESNMQNNITEIDNLLSDVQSIISEIKNYDIGTDVVSTSEVAQDVKDDVTLIDFLDRTWEAVKQLPGEIWGDFKTIVSNIADDWDEGLCQVLEGLTATLVDIVTSLFQGVVEVFDGIADAVIILGTDVVVIGARIINFLFDTDINIDEIEKVSMDAVGDAFFSECYEELYDTPFGQWFKDNSLTSDTIIDTLAEGIGEIVGILAIGYILGGAGAAGAAGAGASGAGAGAAGFTKMSTVIGVMNGFGSGTKIGHDAGLDYWESQIIGLFKAAIDGATARSSAKKIGSKYMSGLDNPVDDITEVLSPVSEGSTSAGKAITGQIDDLSRFVGNNQADAEALINALKKEGVAGFSINTETGMGTLYDSAGKVLDSQTILSKIYGSAADSVDDIVNAATTAADSVDDVAKVATTAADSVDDVALVPIKNVANATDDVALVPIKNVANATDDAIVEITKNTDNAIVEVTKDAAKTTTETIPKQTFTDTIKKNINKVGNTIKEKTNAAINSTSKTIVAGGVIEGTTKDILDGPRETTGNNTSSDQQDNINLVPDNTNNQNNNNQNNNEYDIIPTPNDTDVQNNNDNYLIDEVSNSIESTDEIENIEDENNAYANPNVRFINVGNESITMPSQFEGVNSSRSNNNSINYQNSQPNTSNYNNSSDNKYNFYSAQPQTTAPDLNIYSGSNNYSSADSIVTKPDLSKDVNIRFNNVGPESLEVNEFYNPTNEKHVFETIEPKVEIPDIQVGNAENNTINNNNVINQLSSNLETVSFSTLNDITKPTPTNVESNNNSISNIATAASGLAAVTTGALLSDKEEKTKDNKKDQPKEEKNLFEDINWYE